MTWAEYLAWWQDPVNIARTIWQIFCVCCGYWIGYRVGHLRGRAKGREDAIKMWLGTKLLFPGKFISETERNLKNDR